MARIAILVNGLPGAGKSTLAERLTGPLDLPLLSKDIVKEALSAVLGFVAPDGRPQRSWSRALGAAATEALWALQAVTPHGAILESFWRPEFLDLVVAGIERSATESTIEVWCDVPLELARRRYEQRWPRDAIHGALLDDAEWAAIAASRPLGLGPVIQVDTSKPVDVAEIADRIRRLTAIADLARPEG